MGTAVAGPPDAWDDEELGIIMMIEEQQFADAQLPPPYFLPFWDHMATLLQALPSDEERRAALGVPELGNPESPDKPHAEVG